MEKTMEEQWRFLKENYKMGDWMEGKVVSHLPFGVFLDIGYMPVLGLIRIVNFLELGNMSPIYYPDVGSKVKGIIVEFTEHNHQINLSLRKDHILKFSKEG